VDHDEFLRFGASCESCHRGATSPVTTIGDSQCLNCHAFGLDRMSDVEELHRVHTGGEHKVECFNCHGVPAHGPEAQIMSLNVFDCRGCHQGQHDVQRDTYASNGGAVEAPPTAVTPMFMAHVDCTGCHVESQALGARPASGASVARAVPEACDACHRPGLGAQLVPLWQRTTRRLYDEVEGLLPATAPAPDAGAGPEPAAVREARFLLDLVRSDGSWGVHNPTYTQSLIERARALLIGAAAPAAPPAPHPPAAPQEVPPETQIPELERGQDEQEPGW
jgi:hypothetical protein